jgi:arsenate reductase
MFEPIIHTIQSISSQKVSDDRKILLQPIVDYLKMKQESHHEIRLNFICTHNSRRSHLAQIWTQALAHHFGITNLFCYSGGTEATALFPTVVSTLMQQGFEIQTLSEHSNPIYAIKYDANEPAIIGFSKVYHHSFNPKNNFAALMTCSQADEGCPLVYGAECRFVLNYSDPKEFDHTPLQEKKYLEKSMEIASEIYWILLQLT